MPVRRCFRRWLFAALLTGGAALPKHVAAQQCIGQLGSSLSVDPALIDFSTPTLVDFDAGSIVYQTTVSVSIRTVLHIIPWRLCLQSLTPDLGTSDGITKPIADLEWQSSGAWTPITFAAQTVANGRGNRTVRFNLRIRLAWDADPPGSYGTILRFTIAS